MFELLEDATDNLAGCPDLPRERIVGDLEGIPLCTLEHLTKKTRQTQVETSEYNVGYQMHELVEAIYKRSKHIPTKPGRRVDSRLEVTSADQKSRYWLFAARLGRIGPPMQKVIETQNAEFPGADPIQGDFATIFRVFVQTHRSV